MKRSDRRPRIEDVAAAAGVSIATVSYVFNERGNISEATSARVRQEARRLGYQPSAMGRGLALQRANAVGLLLPAATTSADPWFSLFLAGITEFYQTTHYHLVLLAPESDLQQTGEALLAAIDSRRIDGVILIEAQADDPRVAILHRENIPFVLFGRTDYPVWWVDVDDFLGGQLATQHLLELGHQNIAHVAAPDQYIYGRLRRDGYLQALHDAGRDLQPLVVTGDLTAASGYQAGQRLLTSIHRPTAIFAASDVMASGVLQSAKDLGVHVPQQLSVVGYDDTPTAWQSLPPLTTMSHSAYQSGRTIAELLLHRLQNEDPRHHITTPKLVVRGSTATRSADSTPVVPAEHPRLKAGTSFALVSPNGWMDEEAHGIVCGDMRMVHQYHAEIDGQPLFGTVVATTGQSMDLVYAITKDQTTLRIGRQIQLSDGQWLDRWQWQQYGAPKSWSVEIQSASDFRDTFEIRGTPRLRRGELDTRSGPEGCQCVYQGLDGVARSVSLQLDPPAQQHDGRIYRWVLAADSPSGTLQVNLSWTNPSVFAPSPTSRRSEPAVHITAGDPGWSAVLSRAREDYELLKTDFGNGPVLMAGLPWFATFFGRDAIIAAYQCLMISPETAVNTLRTLARYQGRREDPAIEESPGKMVHEVRLSEMAATGEVPFGQYYGSVDVTPLFLWLLAETWERTGDETLLRDLLPVAELALTWLDEAGMDARGLYTFVPHNGKGLQVQSWKDSDDSMIFHDGRAATPPLAVAEVQGYVYAAKMAMSRVYRHLDQQVVADRLLGEALELQERFDRYFWMPQTQYYAMALDGTGRPLDVLSSDPGQCLWTRIIPQHRIAAVVDWLGKPELFSGWGVRTLAASEPGYDPYSYHRGSVWPHDTSLIIDGLLGVNAPRTAVALAEGLMAAAQYFPYQRLPELFSGEPRRVGPPIPYSRACAPQAWAAGAPLLVATALLGLRVDSIRRVVTLNPAVPSHLGWLQVSDIMVGNRPVTIWTDGASVNVSPLPEGWTVEEVTCQKIALEDKEEL
ncbi:MAG: substrate-binding domain-containing protein [Thermaerobacter sp.]|nr:substrate-binding domain-containing protein [Thermaerobacter sp.]